MKRAVVLVGLALFAVPALHAQKGDSLADVRALYESAAYEDALAHLATVAPDVSAARVEQYRAFCLIALGRLDEASGAVARSVSADPLLVPSASDASPRVRAFFTDARRRILPDIAREAYGQAKAAYAAKDFAVAAAGFQHVSALIDAAGDGAGQADLRLLAQEFLDLSNRALSTAASAPPAPVSATSATSRATPGGSPAAVSSDANVRTGPVAIVQKLPTWNRQVPPRNVQGQLRIQIDEQGNVTSAIIVRPTDPLYDYELVGAAKAWKYEPATSNGKRVPSEKDITYVLKRQP